MAKYLNVAQVAKRTGLALRTVYGYTHLGILPPPAKRDGCKSLYAAGDINYFNEIHKGRPAARRAVKPRKRSRR
jgi:hypothetical protein